MGPGGGWLGAEPSRNGRTIDGVCVQQLSQDHALARFGVLAIVVSGDIVADDRPCKGSAVHGGCRSDVRHALKSVEQKRALREVGSCGMVLCYAQDKNAIP